MTLTEKFLSLRRIPFFRDLSDSDLMLIAEVARIREYAPGEKFCGADHCLQRLYAVVKGNIRTVSGENTPEVMGPASLLFGVPTAEALEADPEHGATCLMINKAHFFTMVYHCPSLLCTLLTAKKFEVNISETANRK